MTARIDDYDEIVRVVQLYIDGFNHNDVSKFKEAFDEDAWIFFIDADGGLHKYLISENFEEWAAPPSSELVSRIVSVTQAGDVPRSSSASTPRADPMDGSTSTICSGSTESGGLRTRPPLTAAGYPPWFELERNLDTDVYLRCHAASAFCFNPSFNPWSPCGGVSHHTYNKVDDQKIVVSARARSGPEVEPHPTTEARHDA
jgi:hypothetical protein